MKQIEGYVTVTKDMIQDYEELFGTQSALSPAFPMTFYRELSVPWTFDASPVHRKQSCRCYEAITCGQTYRCVATLEHRMKKGAYAFYTQTLTGYTPNGKEGFQCVSELVVPLP
ncbi:hypothetical protein [Bacillus thermotolerans]|uniref:hypothetical protein n=1 Tax=Bacillus thermotolerans TaxID=1221996 RepID=UPI000588F281|nr:hypothetical protein [Bacillus thermotolerans]KKB44760.1 hypothetical protein QY96_01041 [Bacillus thermotolerans]